MYIKSLAELREADERTLQFNPVGLGGRMRPEGSAAFQPQGVGAPGPPPAAIRFAGRATTPGAGHPWRA